MIVYAQGDITKFDVDALYSNIKEYEWIIEHIPSAVSVGALV